MDEWKRLRVREYKYLNQMAKKGETVFAGSSLCQNFPINELAQGFGINKVIYNRGIGGFITDELLESMEECIFGLFPSKLFINIGTNDLSRNDDLNHLLRNYERIISGVKERLPDCRIHMMAYYPINEEHDFGLSAKERAGLFGCRTNESIQKANNALKECAGQWGCGFIDVNHVLTDGNGRLKVEYSVEGMHLLPNAYGEILKELIRFL